MDENRYLYVAATNHTDAIKYGESLGYSPVRIRYVNTTDKIRGLRGIVLHVLPSARRMDNFTDILLLAHTHGLTVKRVRWWVGNILEAG